jgi:outer membrane protein
MKSLSLRRSVAAASCALLAATLGNTAHAVEKGDWLLRVGAGHVAPNDSSTGFSGAPTIEAAVDSSTNLALTIAYMVTDNIGVELVGALPFKHDINGAGSGGSSLGKVAETKQLPPTVLAQYYFNSKGSARPYVGAGVNYTFFFDEKTTGALEGTDLSLDSSVGLAVEAGVDIDISKNMFVNFAAWYMDIETTATSSAIGTADVKIDPWVAFVGLGWRF